LKKVKKNNCVSNIPKNIIDDEFPGGCYLCDECGWFLSGAMRNLEKKS
jgi:hypothetical protein